MKIRTLAFSLLLPISAAAQGIIPEGDIWLCSGQSNMELPVRRCMDVVAEDVRDYACPDLHYVKVPLAYNFERPQETLPECRWESLDSPDVAQEWGALCYYILRGLHEASGKPVTIINSSVGGSPVEAWLPEDRLPEWARTELARCRDSSWMTSVLRFNARLYPDWQNAHNALPSAPGTRWKRKDIFSGWGLSGGEPVYGSHLFRRSFRLRARQLEGDALLRLGAMRDADSTFVNGHLVGCTTYQYPPRKYRVPAEFLRKGRNVVEIHLYAAENQGGFVPGKRYCLETSGAEVPLVRGWRYKPGKRMPRRDAQVFLQYKASGLYNAMIAPIARHMKENPSDAARFKGVIWYQGESNEDRPDDYADRLKDLISSWREAFGMPGLPFYIVELAAYRHSESGTAETSGWVSIQDAQRAVAAEMEGVYLIPNRDLGEWNDIHPQDKKTLGERTVRAILESGR